MKQTNWNYWLLYRQKIVSFILRFENKQICELWISTEDGRAEIPSILFYLAISVVILLLNLKLIYVAVKFNDPSAFSVQHKESNANVNGNCPGISINSMRKSFSKRRSTRKKFPVYPLVTSSLMILTITPYWISLALCLPNDICQDKENSLFYLMRLHSLFNPYCTLITHKKFRDSLMRFFKRRNSNASDIAYQIQKERDSTTNGQSSTLLQSHVTLLQSHVTLL